MLYIRTKLKIMAKKLFRIRVIYEDGKNFLFFYEAESGKDAIKDIMELPRVWEATMKYNLLDVQIEELDKLPVPAEDRFWLERRDDDGIYVIIDNIRKMVITFLFEKFYETCKLTDFDGNDVPSSLTKSDLLLEVEIWLQKYYPVLLGIK